MTFNNPSAFWWLLLAIPIVILYLRRHPAPRQLTATTAIWQQVLAEQPIRSWWHRWRSSASLAVQLAILGLLVFALADPDPGGLIYLRVIYRQAAPVFGHRPVTSWLWSSLLGAAVGAIAVEWCLYHRRWTN